MQTFKSVIFTTFRRLSVTLTLDRVIQHTIVYHSSTSTHKPDFVETGKLGVRTGVRMDGEWEWLY